MKKAQTWIFEFILSFLAFLFILFLTFNILGSSEAHSDYEVVYHDANHISNVLLANSIPANWSAVSVSSPGIVSLGRVDLVKLEEFESLSYFQAKSLFGTSLDFVFFFENASGIVPIEGVCYRGFDYSGCGDILDSIEYDDLAIIERVTILNSQIVKMVVYSWT